MKNRKSCMILAIMLSMVMLLAGCGTKQQGQTSSQAAAKNGKASETLVLMVGDEEIYLNEVNYYALSFASGMGVTEDTDLDAEFSQDYPTMDDALKAQFLLTIRQTYILYQKALEEGVTLTDEEEATADEQVQNYLDATSQETLEKFDIDEEMLAKIFRVYQIVQKFEQQIANEMEVEDVSYGTYYNFVLLTVEVDEDGNAVLDDDGNYVEVSQSEKDKQKALAEEIQERLAAGEDAEDLIEEYDLSATSGLMHATTDSLRDTYNLEDGECSEVQETNFGYVVVKITDIEDEEYSNNVKEYTVAMNAQDYVEEKESEWFDAFPIEDDDVEQDVWDAFTFKDFQ